MKSPKQHIEALREEKGIERFPHAVETLLAEPRTIGGIVVRQCFDPGLLSLDDLDRETILPDDIQAPVSAMLARWWKKHGSRKGRIDAPSFQTMKPGDGLMVNDNLPHKVLSMYASLSGRQTLSVQPYINSANTSSPIPHAPDLQAASIKAMKPLPEFRSTLLPGDIAILMGEPFPARLALKSSAKVVSSYAVLSYHRKKRIISEKKKPSIKDVHLPEF